MLGTLVALGAAGRGYQVELHERRPQLLGGASATGEGKIHLGLVYALGHSETAEAMLRSALGFDRAVDHLVGTPLDWARLRGPRFRYTVAVDSLVPPEGLIGHGDRLDALRMRLVDEDPNATYLGETLGSCRLRPLPDRARWFDTDERCVDVVRLGSILVDALGDGRPVSVHLESTVVDVEQVQGGWRLLGCAGGGESWTSTYDIVVNCAWDDAARLDRRADRPRDASPNLRLRSYLGGRVESPPLAVTIVHGPFGDVVVHHDGRLYASWYPTGLLGFVNAETAPSEWESVLDDPSVRAAQIDATLHGLRQHVPELGEVHDVTVSTGVVVAHGNTDIDDPRSGLHERDETGFVADEGWISVRSTKFTSAPVAARGVVDLISQVTG